MKESFSRAVIFRIISSLLILFFLISFMFFLLRISPGGPEQKFISPQLSPELIQKVKESFNLDKPITEQYSAFLVNSVKGNFGVSYNYREPVFDVIMEYLPFTLTFALIVVIVQLLLSFWLSFISISKLSSRTDMLISKFTLLLYSIPTFVAGVFLIYIFSEKLNILLFNLTVSLFNNFRCFLSSFSTEEALFTSSILISFCGFIFFLAYIE